MSKVLITTYRGFDIEFDIQYERFQCVITDELSKESASFNAVKTFIDEYKKNNQDFKPFWVESFPNNYKEVKLKIIGIRKDGRFISEDDKGDKHQVSDYDLAGLMLVKPENVHALNLLNTLKQKEQLQRDENKLTRENIMATLNVVTLKDYKTTLEL